MKETKVLRKHIVDLLNKKLEKKQSIANWASGFYVCTGGPHGFNLKVPIFGCVILPNEGKEHVHNVAKVLVDYLNEMFWINVDLHDIFRDEQRICLCPEVGQKIRKQLEEIKSYGLN